MSRIGNPYRRRSMQPKGLYFNSKSVCDSYILCIVG